MGQRVVNLVSGDKFRYKMIICLICGKKFKIVSPSHLKYKHNITVREYLKKYPGCETGYDIMCKKQKQTNLKLYGVENVSYLDFVKKKIIEKNTGKKHKKTSILKMSKSHKGKILSKKHKNNISKNGRLSIEYINKKYPFFSQIEEMRYNTDEKEIQVHCKNHNCLNSKEKDGWFTPTYNQLYERIRQLNQGNDGSYFYCCDECKINCPLFNLRSDYILNNKKSNNIYTSLEYQTFRKFVLERDNYICQFCGEKATDVHHERPQKLEPFFALDPDFAWSCCKKCHYKYGHKDGCSTGRLATVVCI